MDLCIKKEAKMLLLAIICVFVAGAFGGVVNSVMAGNNRFLPHREVLNKFAITQPGILWNIVLGGIAALVSWGLYGPFAAVKIIGGKTPEETAISVSLSTLAGAVLIGIGGARWLTSHADERFLRAAGSEAATSHRLSRAIAILSPAMAFRAVFGDQALVPNDKNPAAGKKGKK